MPKKVLDVALATIVFSFPEKTLVEKVPGVDGEGMVTEETKTTIEPGFEPITFQLHNVPSIAALRDAVGNLPEILVQTALHGISQKIGDSYAGAAKDGPEVGLEPVLYAKAQIESMIQQIYNEKWYAVRQAGGGAQNTILVRAYAQATGKTLEEALDFVEPLSDDEKKQLQKLPKIAAAIAGIRAEAAVAKAKALAEKAAAAG